MVDVLSRKLIDTLEFIRGFHKWLLYDLSCLQIHGTTLDLDVIILNVIV